MCPIRVHWHVKTNYKDYWRVKIAITNFNYRMNHTLWTLAVQHPNLNNVTQVFSFDYKSVAPYGSISKSLTIKDSTFWTKHWNVKSFLMQMILECSMERSFTMIFWWKRDLQGMFSQRFNLLQKDQKTFIFKQGWAFPRKVYFNGDECMLPPPDSYPFLPNSARGNLASFWTLSLTILILMFISIWWLVWWFQKPNQKLCQFGFQIKIINMFL